MRVLQNLFSADELLLIRSRPEVSAAYQRLSTENSAYFTIPASLWIKQRLAESFQLKLDSISNIPCRWIKGDTPAHIDRGQRTFQDTYLVYLTDGEGEFRIGEGSYSMQAGTAFSFSEGVSHEVVNTNGTSRLLLGPMSEFGFPVGASNTITADGATETLYFSQDGSTKYYRINNGDLTSYTGAPVYIQNTNASPASNILKVIFATSLTMTDIYSYFIADSVGIQFGSTSVDSLGNKANIVIDSVTGYPGLIQNGASSSNGNNSISVYNLLVSSVSSTLASGAGWIGQSYFGKGTTNNYVINCTSDGDIDAGGGILGNYAQNVTLIGCSSRGEIQSAGGGIVGQEVTSVVIQSCWSTGAISGNGSGGIVGSNSISAEITKCYSEGIISGNNAGGIVGGNAGIDSVTITKCYSRGTITGANAGGICGSLAPGSGTLSVTITNCYSAGNLDNTGVNLNGCICGPLSPYSSGSINLAITNSYATGTVVLSKGYMIGNITTINGSQLTNPVYILTNNFSEAGSSGGSAGTWSDTNAANVLTGEPSSFPGVGSTWASIASNTAFELANLGATPYQTQTISGNALVQSYSQSIQQGGETIEALAADASGNDFRILDKSGGTAASYSTITISSQTGKISTTSATAVGTYTLSVRSTGSYYITTFFLRVTEYIPPPAEESSRCCKSTMDERDISYEWINDYRIGNRLIVEHSQNPNLKFNGYSEYVKYKMAQAQRRN